MSLIIDGSNSGTALSDTATQTLSNKTLVSPVITGTPVLPSGTWTPVISSTTGSITSYTTTGCNYIKLGRLVFIQFEFQITDNGTGAGELRMTLPYSASGTASGVARERTAVGFTATLQVLDTSSYATIVKTATDLYAGGSSYRFVGSMTYLTA